jgi:hypothetical protein
VIGRLEDAGFAVVDLNATGTLRKTTSAKLKPSPKPSANRHRGSILVGRLLHDKLIEYKKYSDLRPFLIVPQGVTLELKEDTGGMVLLCYFFCCKLYNNAFDRDKYLQN